MEKSVQRSIIERIGRSELKDLFGEVLLPIEKVKENRNGRKFETERRMYPGYVFVEMVMTEETWHLINSTPRVIEFLGNNHPVPLSDAEIAAIKDAKGVNVGAKITAGSIRLSNSVAEMARGMNVPASELEHTLEEYNKHASEKSADAFGRTVYAQTIDKPPFYWGQERLMIHATLGGLKTDLHGRVKRKDGSTKVVSFV